MSTSLKVRLGRTLSRYVAGHGGGLVLVKCPLGHGATRPRWQWAGGRQPRAGRATLSARLLSRTRTLRALWAAPHTVQRLAWRVDVVTSSKVQTSAQPLTEPTAVIELRTGGRLAPTASGVVVFEVNRAQLGGMLDEVARIEAVIAKHGGAAHDAEEGL